MDVTPADPSTADPAQAGVTAPADRPVKNLQAEFNRKFQKLEDARAEETKKLDAILSYLGSIVQPAAPAAPAPVAGDTTDEDLWRRAQSGDRAAFEEWTDRRAERKLQERLGQHQTEQMVRAQLDAVVNRYPVLRDMSHPLTQHANAVVASLRQAGYAMGPALLLEAAKTAIADRPDLVVQLQAPAPTGARPRAATQTGVSHRASPAPATPDAIRAPTPAEQALANRMGIKDPKGAKERFLARRESGRSNLGSVSAHLDDQEF